MGIRLHFMLWSALLVVSAVVTGSFSGTLALGQTVSVALHASIHAVAGAGILLLYIPAALTAFMSSLVAKRWSVKVALPVFIVGLIPSLLLYMQGQWDAAIALFQEKWTAASLTVALYFYFALFWALAFALIVWLVLKLVKPRTISTPQGSHESGSD